MKLEALILKGILKQIICKFAQDNCYTNAILPNKPPMSKWVLKGLALLSLPASSNYGQEKILILDPDKDICDQNGKPSTPLSPIPFIYYTSIPW